MGRYASGKRALAEDGSASSTYITPKAYYPGT